MTTLIESLDGRRFLQLSPTEVETVRRQGGALYLVDGAPAMELHDGAALRAFSGDGHEVAPVVAREGKRR